MTTEEELCKAIYDAIEDEKIGYDKYREMMEKLVYRAIKEPSKITKKDIETMNILSSIARDEGAHKEMLISLKDLLHCKCEE